jgi:acetoin utilization deacetylase AcuC-like enzyme
MARVEAPAVAPAVLEAIHPPRYVRGIDELAASGGGAIDTDTIVSEGSYEAALHGAGGAVALVDLLLSGEAPTGFSALRPPGHHAEPAQAMGFCLFNNVAVAARHARDAHGLERVLVLDWDVHHGNGTNAAFHDSAEVLFVSIHQSPLYPGTGPSTDVGSGDGIGYTVNLPVPAGTGDAAYASLLEHVVVPVARAYMPQLVLISAGFDAHRDDPLAEIQLSEAGFAAMTGTMRRLAAELEAPLGAVLEGGYDLDALAASTLATLQVLTAPDPPPAPALAVAPEARAAAARVAVHWPALMPG